MALSLSITATELSSCQTMAIYDKTGVYNAITNTGGYGGVNFDLSDAVAVAIDVTLPSGTVATVSISLPSYTIPEDTGLVAHYVTAEDLGLGTGASLPDGYYEIAYRVEFTDASSPTGTTEVETTTNCYFFCQVKCCVDKIVAQASFEDCCTKPQDFMNLIRAYVMFKGLKEAIRCAKINKANRLLGQLQKHCVANRCNC